MCVVRYSLYQESRPYTASDLRPANGSYYNSQMIFFGAFSVFDMVRYHIDGKGYSKGRFEKRSELATIKKIIAITTSVDDSIGIDVVSF